MSDGSLAARSGAAGPRPARAPRAGAGADAARGRGGRVVGDRVVGDRVGDDRVGDGRDGARVCDPTSSRSPSERLIANTSRKSSSSHGHLRTRTSA
jgi:hypothetical protein